jgi:hypothetical protein
MIERIENLLSDAGAIYAVLSSTDGSTWEEYGDAKKIPSQGIVSSYFAGPEAIDKLVAFLKDHLLPRMVIQGDVVPYPMRATPLAKMRKGRALDARLKSELGA